jgi:outer membrane protein TolC
VLTSAQTVLQAQQQLMQSTASASADLVQLYKALGGGWEVTFPAAPEKADIAASAPPQRTRRRR